LANIKKSILEKVYANTAYFEGGYKALAGNADGQGISLGFLQWNFGQKTLQPLLLRVFNDYPQLAIGLLPSEGQWLKLALDNDTAYDWSLQIQENNYVLDPWRTAFYSLCCTPEFQQIQNDAAQVYLNIAINMAEGFGITTDRGLALCFDIAVQLGGLRPYELAEPTYIEKLEAVANAGVAKSSSRWQEDVRKRKFAIVYGYDLGRGYSGIEFTDESMYEEEVTETETVENNIPEATQSINLLHDHNIISNVDDWIPYVYDGGTVEGINMYYLILKFVACYYTRDNFNDVVYTLSGMILKDGTAIIGDTQYWMENAQEGQTCEGKNVEVVINRMAQYIRENS
jgi:hypothetical protein